MKDLDPGILEEWPFLVTGTDTGRGICHSFQNRKRQRLQAFYRRMPQDEKSIHHCRLERYSHRLCH